MSALRRGIVAAMFSLLLLTAFNIRAASDYYFKVSDVFGIQPPYDTNRVFKLQSLSPFAGQFFWRTSSVAGDFWVSNAISAPVIGNTYAGQMLAPPFSLTFSFFVPNTNMGTVLAQNYTALPANTVNSYPAGQTAVSWQAALNIFALSTNGPGGSVNSSQVSNIVLSAIPATFWSPSASVWIHNLITVGSLNTNQFAAGTLMGSTTNSAGLVTFTANSQTNGYTDIVRSNALLFAGTNLIFVTSNALQSAIGSAGASLVQVTNISSNTVYSATNTYSSIVTSNSAVFASTNLMFVTSNSLASQISAAGVSAVTVTNISSNTVFNATNTIAITSGLSAYVSTNRFDVSGAAAIKANTNSPTIWTPSLFNPLLLGNLNAGGNLATNVSAITTTNLGLIMQWNGGFWEERLGIWPMGSGIQFSANPASPTILFVSGANNDSFIIHSNGVFDVLGPKLVTSFAEITDSFTSDAGAITTDSSGNMTAVSYAGSGAGLTNIPAAGISTNGSSANQVLTSIGGVSVWTNVNSVAGAAITNAYATNAAGVLVTGQRAYISTNYDALGGSNALFTRMQASNLWFQVSKMGVTNDFSVGQTASNLTTEGNVSFGMSGQATNIIDGRTNLVKFVNAGSGIASNGVFIWSIPLGCYTNWITAAIWTNSGSSWLMITNGASPLYTLSGSSPFGVTATGTGGLPAPAAVPTFFFDHNGMQDVGWFSVTNINFIVTNATANAIASTNGIGYNTTIYGGTNFAINIKNGTNQSGLIGGFFDAILSGASNQISAGGGTYGSVIAGGVNNGMPTGSSFSNSYCAIVGGFNNQLGSGANYGFIGGGYYNYVLTNAQYGVINGGQSNLIGSSGFGNVISGGEWNIIYNANTNANDSIIAGGRSNRIYGAQGFASGRNVTVSNDNVFAWGDGIPLTSQTNNSFLIQSSNGVAINTNWPGTNTLEVNGWVDSTKGFTILGVPVSGGGGGITLSQATNTVNGSSGVIGTNGTDTTFKFSSTGTNVIQGLAQAIANTSSNAALGNAQTAINTTSNSLNTSINTASNSVFGNAQTSINTTSNGLQAQITAGGITAVQATNISQFISNTTSNSIVTAQPFKTNYIAFDWGSFGTTTNAGNALVLDGFDSGGSPMVKGTNWPTGGGSVPNGLVTNFGLVTIIAPALTISNSSGALSSQGTFNSSIVTALPFGDSAEIVNIVGKTNGNNSSSGGFSGNWFVNSGGKGGLMLQGGSTFWFTNDTTKNYMYGDTNWVVHGGTNGVDTYTINPTNGITAISITANSGSVSLIPTNASVIYTSNGFPASLPAGLTNVLAGRAQPVVQYYVVDAVTGVPIMTVSNETSGVKLRIGYGGVALIETNFFTLPITSTNTIWRARDESTGSGASVGIITNWFIGL